MKIDGIKPIESITTTDKIDIEKKNINKEKAKEEAAAVYEKGKDVGTKHVYDKNAILKLKAESDKALDSLRRIVEELLIRQGKTVKLFKPDDVVLVDEEAQLEAQALIGPEGDLGIEKTSQRIVDFAIALSGGDKTKLDTLRKAIDKGFKEAEKVLGELPEISRETYDRIMEKLDAWENEE